MTKAQYQRRGAILNWLTERLARAQGVCTANEVREYLARHKSIYVTVDTVQRDLNAMQKAKSVHSIRVPNRQYAFGWLRTGSTCTLCGAATKLSNPCGNCLPEWNQL